MSNDLIRRSDAIKVAKEFWYKPDIAGALAELPTIEPKCGEWLEWIDCEGEVFWKCSACGQASEASVAGILYKFCPFCGADMRKGADDE